MKLTGPCCDLAESWNLAASVINPKAAKPVLANVKMIADAGASSVRLLATDFDSSMDVSVKGLEVAESGEILLPGLKTGQALTRLINQDVVLELREGLVRITTPHDNYSINAATTEEFPTLPEFDEQRTLRIKHQDFTEMVDKVAYAVAIEPLRYALNGVLLIIKKDRLEMVGSDGHRMAHIQRKAHFEEEFPENLIVPVRGLRLFEKLLTPEDKFLDINVLETQIVARSSRGQASTKLVEGQYPNFRAVVPEGPEYKATLDRQFFQEKLENAAVFTSVDSQAVTMTLTSGLMTLTSHTATAGDAKAELPIDYDGADIKLKFVARYLGDFLKHIKEDQVVMEIKDERKAVIFRAGKDFFYLVMPLGL